MSYIHEALKKAQREKDFRQKTYGRIFSSESQKNWPFRGRRVRWLVAFVLIFLAFGIYSWLDSEAPTTLDNAPAPPDHLPSVEDQKEIKGAGELYEEGRGLHQDGRFEEAKALYEKALEIDPGYLDALNNLGVLYMREKKYEEAREVFEKAIRLKPVYVDPFYNLACTYAIMGQRKEGLAYLKRAVSLDPIVKEWARKDSDLESLRGSSEFDEIIVD